MQNLPEKLRRPIELIAARHGLSAEATSSMLEAMIRGGGGMAQFSHPEFGGPGQWMSGGMTMVSDMFNQQLTARVEGLCNDLAGVVRSEQAQGGSTRFSSQQQRSTPGPAARAASGNDPVAAEADSDSRLSASWAAAGDAVPQLQQWWPSGLGSPNSTGDQDGVRYAYFARARRLAIQAAGRVTLYDTLDHQISGFSQQQPDSGSPTFYDQRGPVDVTSLPVISGS